MKRVEVIDARAALEARTLARNNLHFAQAQGTPFTTEELKHMDADNALDFFDDAGNPIDLPADTFKETVEVLKALRKSILDRPPAINGGVTLDDFISALLHWNERTSASPSG